FVQRNIFPQRETFDFTTQPHQDKVHIGGDTNYAMWVPLGDCPMEKGSLAVATASHVDGVLDTRVGTGAGGMDIAAPVTGTWVTGDFKAGDVLIFSDVTVHQALPNRTPELRQSFDARYQPLSRAVADKNLDTYAGTGTWEEVYATWDSTEDQFYWRDLELNVVPLDMQYYERRDVQAFEMAERGDLAARDTLLRIVQRDADPSKRSRAEALLSQLDPIEQANRAATS
ncbi:MAG: phytanoyl-CoA dioxygenase family protein, partial [Gammaproteobacteria bacterium]|nr:phytanoyl-CoA dioxygenase family protein [Gammaproteobacteria bacterium]